MTNEIIVDAENSVVGRLGSFVAKKALQGNKVTVVNSEKAIIIGKKDIVINRYIERRQLGKGVQKGPNMPSRSDMILRRMIRGMLPWHKTTGRNAFKLIYCYKGIPEKYKNKEKDFLKLESKKALNYMTIQDISRELGKQ